MAALPERAGGGAYLGFELHAQGLHPLHCAIGVLGQEVHQLRGAHIVAALQGLGVEFLNGVLDALGSLATGVNRVERALGDVGGAAGNAQLLQNDDLCAVLLGGDGSRKAGPAAADNDHVGVIGQLPARAQRASRRSGPRCPRPPGSGSPWRPR